MAYSHTPLTMSHAGGPGGRPPQPMARRHPATGDGASGSCSAWRDPRATGAQPAPRRQPAALAAPTAQPLQDAERPRPVAGRAVDGRVRRGRRSARRAACEVWPRRQRPRRIPDRGQRPLAWRGSLGRHLARPTPPRSVDTLAAIRATGALKLFVKKAATATMLEPGARRAPHHQARPPAPGANTPRDRATRLRSHAARTAAAGAPTVRVGWCPSTRRPLARGGARAHRGAPRRRRPSTTPPRPPHPQRPRCRRRPASPPPCEIANRIKPTRVPLMIFCVVLPSPPVTSMSIELSHRSIIKSIY